MIFTNCYSLENISTRKKNIRSFFCLFFSFHRRCRFIKRQKFRTHNFSLRLFTHEMSVNFGSITLTSHRKLRSTDSYKNVMGHVSCTKTLNQAGTKNSKNTIQQQLKIVFFLCFIQIVYFFW